MKRKNQLQRVESIIKNDRLSTREDFKNLFILDLDKLLKDYFDYKNLPNFEIVKMGDRLMVNISVCASAIKPFLSLKEE